MQISKVNSIFEILQKEFSFFDEEIGLKYGNHYQLLIAILLSAQTTDVVVNKVAKNLFLKLKEPSDAIALGVDGINKIIANINYHNVKSKYIYQMSKQIIENFNGIIPNEFDKLVSLKGIGRKTANLFLSIAFKKSNIAVDTHVFRVSNRIGIVKANNVLETEKQLIVNVPKKEHRKINSLLIQFGRKYCNAKKPKCSICPIKQYCEFYKKNK